MLRMFGELLIQLFVDMCMCLNFIARLDWVDLILYDTIVRFPRMCVVLTM